MIEERYAEKAECRKEPLLITAHGAPLDTAALQSALRQGCDAVALLDAAGLHADSVQRAEDRFFDFYARAVTAASDCGEALFLCPLLSPSPVVAQHALFPRALLLSQLTALLRISASVHVALIFPCIDGEHLRLQRALLEQTMSELFGQGIPFDDFLSLGVQPVTADCLHRAELVSEDADFLMLDTDLSHTDGAALPLEEWEAAIRRAHAADRPVALRGSRAPHPRLLEAGADALCLPYA